MCGIIIDFVGGWFVLHSLKRVLHSDFSPYLIGSLEPKDLWITDYYTILFWLECFVLMKVIFQKYVYT